MKAKYYSTSELAKQAGTSRQVISAILNETWQNKRISQATYDRVQSIIEEIGYVPDRAATNLRKQTSDTLGIIYHGPLHSHVLDAVQRFNHHFLENKQEVEIAISSENKLQQALTHLMGHRVQRVLILLSSLTKTYGEELGDRAILRLLKAMPTVVYNYPFGILPKELDNQLIEGGNQLVGFSRSAVYHSLFEKIVESKNSKVLLDQKIFDMICTDPKIYKHLNSCKRVETFPNPQFDNVQKNPYQMGEELGNSLLPMIKKSPGFDYLITASDMIGQGVAHVLSNQGIKTPKDLQIVGFDKVDALPYFKHPISTIEVPVEKMVGQTIDLLSNMPQSGGTYLARANYLKSNN
jgi:DNA-binding LacI/PurR family transcriptional regulator